MVRVIFEPERGQRVPVRVWARAISDETVRQFQRLASQPYVVEFVGAMADAHVASDVAVGSVFATEHTVVPSALGGDLGCGMSAFRLSLDARGYDLRVLKEVVRALGRAIPTGDTAHRGAGVAVPDSLLATPLSTGTLDRTRALLARRHLGTLGGGNHFLELDRDADGGMWMLVHSGSRGLGGAVAGHHARVAAGADGGSLAGLDTTHETGAAYLADHTWALTFARANRAALAARAAAVVSDVLGQPLTISEVLDVHHNFVAVEEWFGRSLLVHRKGAVGVQEGALALIPGSMGTASYVVEGVGSADAFGSCSHGAGRVMSRKEARATIRPERLVQAMRRVAYPEWLALPLVEEAPDAYRDIREVLEDQEDLVRRRIRLEPIAVLKG